MCISNKNILYLHFHRVSVDLAHVLSPVLSLHAPDIERPRVVIVVCDAQPRIVRDDVLMNCQYSFRVRLDPRYLNPVTIDIQH